MTPLPDPVAALEAAHHVDDMGLFDGEVTLAALIDAGWSLSHDSERRSAVIGSERSDNEALVAAIPEDPFIIYFNGPSHYLCYRCRGKRPDHAEGCPWPKARAAIAVSPTPNSAQTERRP